MVGLLLLAILTIAVITSLAYPRFMAVSTAKQQAAIHAANEILEEALSMGYSSADLALGTVAVSNLAARYTLNGAELSGIRTVSDWDGATPPTKLITVSITYEGGERPVVLETIMTP